MTDRNSEIRELLQEQPETTVALNPLTGLQWEDLRDIASKVATQGARQPLILGKHFAGHLRKLVDILADSSDFTPDKRDRRFQDESWQESSFYRRLMQSYVALNESLHEWADDLELDEIDRLKADFLLRVIGDSISPTNTLLGNPVAMRKAIATRGQSLIDGLTNFIDDFQNNHGIPAQVKPDIFKVGENLATTPGAVVFKNEVLELIQYTPVTDKVYRRPLMMISAMINKFYCLDMTPDRSLVKYAVDQGFQVFIVSWFNPGAEQSDWGVEKYSLAVVEAIRAVQSITRSKDINLFALCSGAMAMAAMAAYLSAKADKSIHSFTVGVCMLAIEKQDMEMSAFVNQQTFDRVKRRSAKAGVLRGHELASSMLWLRPRDLIWGNVVNNYLLGNEPPEFDLLYWNNDWTSLPAQLHADVIDMFSTGCLLQKGGMSIDGTELDLATVDCDKFVVGALSDHITPWKACYRYARVYSGEVEFVLSNSGHIQTLLNSPAKKRASYFVNKAMPEAADEWLDSAELEQGSWWDHWSTWLKPRSSATKTAPARLGNKKYSPLAAAPGEYVHQQSE